MYVHRDPPLQMLQRTSNLLTYKLTSNIRNSPVVKFVNESKRQRVDWTKQEVMIPANTSRTHQAASSQLKSIKIRNNNVHDDINRLALA